MTNVELVNKAIEVALAYKTVYAKGMFGHVITQSNIDSKTAQYPEWYLKQDERNKKHLQTYINKGYFGFDCVCLIKGLIWGWSGDYSKSVGGVNYNSGVLTLPDSELETVYSNECSSQSVDFGNIAPR